MTTGTAVAKIKQTVWAELPINLSHAMIISNHSSNNIEVTTWKMIIDIIQFRIEHAKVFCTFDDFIYLLYLNIDYEYKFFIHEKVA